MLRHKKIVHDSLKILHRCHMCGLTFEEKSDLENHYTTHPTENDFTMYQSAFKKTIKIMTKNLQVKSSGELALIFTIIQTLFYYIFL